MENLEHFVFEANQKKDKLSYYKIKKEIKRGIKRFQQKINTKMIKNHFISLVICAALAFIVIDVILIVNFMNLLQVL